MPSAANDSREGPASSNNFKDSKSRRTVRLPGFKSLLLRQTEWTDEFYSSVHSFLPEQRPLHPVFLGLGIMRMHCHSPDIPA
jgi:hypothetical protein